MDSGIVKISDRLPSTCRFVVIVLLVLNLASAPAWARTCSPDIPPAPPHELDVLDSNVEPLRFVRLPEAQHVVIDGRIYSHSGLYNRSIPTAPRYVMDEDRDYSYFSTGVISDDGRYVVLHRPVIFADFNEEYGTSKSHGEVLEFYSDGWRIARYTLTYFVTDTDEVVRSLHQTCNPRPQFQWIKGHWFDAATNRYFVHTAERVLFVFDITAGTILARVEETGPYFRAQVEKRDGVSVKLEHIKKCDSMFALMAETSADPELGFTGFSGPAQDGQTGSIISVPFVEISRVDVNPKSGPEMVAAEVQRRDGGSTTLYLEYVYSFCGLDDEGEKVRIGLDELKSLSGLELVEADPEQVALAKSFEQEINNLVEHKKAKPNWTQQTPEAVKVIHYQEFAEAAGNGDHERVMSFLSLGADPGYSWVTSGLWRQSALHAAISGGRFLECELMLNNASSVGFDDEDPILLDTVRILIESGDDPALLRCMELLLKKGANPNVDSERGPPLVALLELDRVDILYKFLENGADANSDLGQYGRPLGRAKSREAVEALLKHGADPDLDLGYGETALFARVSSNADRGIIEEMLKAGGDPNIHPSNTSSMLWLACAKKDVSTVELLAKHGANLNEPGSHGETPLFGAVANGQIDIADALLRNGADPNHENERGETALFKARSAEMIELLGKHGANMNVVDKHGKSKLGDAVSSDRIDLAESMLKAGADANGAPTIFGSHLAYAVIFTKTEMVKVLVKYGADPDAIDKQGEPILHKAAQRPTEILAALLEAGADPDVRDMRGKTPLERLCASSPPAGPEFERTRSNIELLIKYSTKPVSPDGCPISTST